MMTDIATAAAEPALLGEFGRIIAQHGYTEDAFLEARSSAMHHGRPDLVVLSRRTRHTGFDTIFALFYVGVAVSRSEVSRLFGETVLAGLLRAGIVHARGDALVAAMRIVPFRELLLASDREPYGNEPWREDHVLGVGAASITLAWLTVRTVTDSVLDLGTGAGLQALLAAPHTRRMTGTDTSPRALSFARLNAALNGIASLQLREGSFFEPVRDERFGLIVANPPFVISPGRRLTYRDGGREGDTVSELVVRGVQQHLEEGGFASVLVNWHHKTGDDWAERPRSWIEPGCDAWLLRLATSTPLDYAADWLRQTDATDPGVYARRLDEWVAYYERLGIGRLSAGAVILRRQRTASNWVRADTVPERGLVSDASAQIEQVFVTEDGLRTADAERLLELRFQLDPAVELRQRIGRAGDGLEVRAMEMKRTQGLSFAGNIDATVLAFVQALDDRRTLREVVDAIAEADGDRRYAAGLDLAASLWRYGFITPSPAPAGQDSPPRP